MPGSTKRNLRRLPKVALLVETTLGSGRDMLKGIAQYISERGPWSIYHEPWNIGDERAEWLARWDGDGIIARLRHPALVRAVKQSGHPVVDVLGELGDPRIPLVHVDDAAIAELAARHLLSIGLRHFGFCGMAGTNWSDRRRQRFVEIIRREGFSCSEFEWPAFLSGRGGRVWDRSQARLAAWLKALPKPVGVMVCSDQRGVAVLDACRRAGVAVPEQAAVIGVDNDDALCSVCDPPLTSVIPNHVEIGYRAAALLDRMMRDGSDRGHSVRVQPSGIQTRRSTDTLAIHDVAVLKALHFIRNHACEGVPVDEVARYAGVSRSVLQRRFRRLLGHSIHHELVTARVHRAMRLLSEGDLPIPEIAEVAGFTHQEYLGVVFKSFTGRTPAAFRRESRHGHG